MTTKRFVEFMTQSTDDGELNCGFYDIQTKKYYYTKDGENSKEITDLLNEIYDENRRIKQTLSDMIVSERTHIGKNVLIQFQEAIE